jgi:two-component system, NtrC family, sensor kinase
MDSAAESQLELERLRTENAELRTRLQEYQTIFDSMPIMFWYKDTENRHIRVNRAAAELEGKHVDEIEGKSAHDIYTKEQADAYHKDDQEVIKANAPKLNIIEQHIVPATGETMWMQTGKVPYRDKEGNVIGIIVFAVDITEQKRAENVVRETHKELEKRNRQMARVHEFFLATLEHLLLSTSHGINKDELTSYLKDTRAQFESLNQATR